MLRKDLQPERYCRQSCKITWQENKNSIFKSTVPDISEMRADITKVPKAFNWRQLLTSEKD